MATINKEMTFAEVLQIDQQTAPIFLKYGMSCIGCPIGSMESLEMGAAAHGVPVESLLKDLNDFFAEQESKGEQN